MSVQVQAIKEAMAGQGENVVGFQTGEATDMIIVDVKRGSSAPVTDWLAAQGIPVKKTVFQGGRLIIKIPAGRISTNAIYPDQPYVPETAIQKESPPAAPMMAETEQAYTGTVSEPTWTQLTPEQRFGHAEKYWPEQAVQARAEWGKEMVKTGMTGQQIVALSNARPVMTAVPQTRQNAITWDEYEAQRQRENIQRIESSRFIRAAEDEAAKGNPAAWLTAHATTKFTQTDPFGFATVNEFFLGSGFEGVRGIRQEALREIYTKMTTLEGTPKEASQAIYDFYVTSPIVTHLPYLLVGGVVGKAVGIAGGAAASHLTGPLATKATAFLAQHSKTIQLGAYGAWAGLGEAPKVQQMLEQNYPASMIGTEVSKDVLDLGLFSAGFSYGLKTPSPISYGKMKVGDDVLYKGIYLRYGPGEKVMPLIGRTQEGWKLGTPHVQLPSGAIQYTPQSGLETKLTLGALAGKEKEKAVQALKVMAETEKQKSAFIGSFPEETKTLGKGGVKVVKDALKNKAVTEAYGSFSAKAQMKGFNTRTPGDIDIQLNLGQKGAEKYAQELVTKLKAAGENVRISKMAGESTLIEALKGSEWKHAVDIHYIGQPTPPSLYGSAGGEGYGFKLGQATTKIEGVKSMPLSEQGLRKGISSLMVNEGGKLGPLEHRAKDVTDFLVAQKVLIESKKAGFFSFLKKGSITKAETALGKYGKLVEWEVNPDATIKALVYSTSKGPVKLILPSPPASARASLPSSISAPARPSPSLPSASASKLISPSASLPSAKVPRMIPPSSPSPMITGKSPSPSPPSRYPSPSFSGSASLSISKYASKSPSPSGYPSVSPSPSPSPKPSPYPSPSMPPTYYSKPADRKRILTMIQLRKKPKTGSSSLSGFFSKFEKRRMGLSDVTFSAARRLRNIEGAGGKLTIKSYVTKTHFKKGRWRL